MDASEAPGSDQEVFAAAFTLMVDDTTSRVVAAMKAAGVRPILLKGPAIARWLYREDEVRAYSDVDLIVGPEDLDAAEGVLEELGFRREGLQGVHRIQHADTWLGGPSAISVDLHRSLFGVRGAAERAWERLSDRTETIEVAGEQVEILAVPARALHVALHATQHGAEGGKSVLDLHQALQIVPEEEWRRSARLADELDAAQAFAAGLRLLPEGEALAARLDLSHEASVTTVLRASTPPPVALGVERLASTPGLWPKLGLLARKVVPEPEFMRAWSRLARRGPLGLAASYLLRPLWLAWRAGPALAAWRRAQRESRGRTGG